MANNFVEKINNNNKSENNLIGTDCYFKRQILWINVFVAILLHIMAIYGIILIQKASYFTHIWVMVLLILNAFGITIGAHRFYSHRAFKAHIIVQILLLFFYTISAQHVIYKWAKNHRQHHKFSDTDADPHNSNRGFFFSHIGWLLSTKHPEVLKKSKTIDTSDLKSDPLVMFQLKYRYIIYPVCVVLIPIGTPIYFWNENLDVALCYPFALRLIFSLHATWTVNSVSHIWGSRPYDSTIKPAENLFISKFLTLGESSHNFHHAFPYDYRAADTDLHYSLSTRVIDFLAFLGLVYDLKYTKSELIKNRALKRGDGSHPKIPSSEDIIAPHSSELNKDQ